ncbi:MAG: amino acid ABC transporter permease [Clostridiales bacterium]|nr:amino acid ABC transporter permease [Clostridiales bacterium]
MSFDWRSLLPAIPVILIGLKSTLQIALGGIALGFVLGILAGLARTSAKTNPLSVLAGAYIAIIRGTPLMVQALYIYFAIPMLVGVDFPRMAAGILAIGLNSGAYFSEVVRGAIQAIDVGQREAGTCLGLSRFHIMTGIVFPQAFKIMIPGLGNQFIISVKDTSLLTVIGVAEMTRQATQLVAKTFKTVEIYTALALVYLVLIGVLSGLLRQIERKVR